MFFFEQTTNSEYSPPKLKHHQREETTPSKPLENQLERTERAPARGFSSKGRGRS